MVMLKFWAGGRAVAAGCLDGDRCGWPVGFAVDRGGGRHDTRCWHRSGTARPGLLVRL